MTRKICLENKNAMKEAKPLEVTGFTRALSMVTLSLRLKIMRVVAERTVRGRGRMTRSITLTIEKRRLEFDGVQNKRNTDLLTCLL